MTDLYPAISEQESKLITALKHKKYRESEQLFVAEGLKVIQDLMQSYQLRLLIVEDQKMAILDQLTDLSDKNIRRCDNKRMRKLSSLDTPREILAVFEIPQRQDSSFTLTPLTLCLDAIQNPGNMGTLIRLCDWLGITNLICGTGCVDLYNPKVVQSTAGAMCSLKTYEKVELPHFLQSYPFTQIIGTRMDGTPLSMSSPIEPSDHIAIIFGNEGHGLSPDIQQLCSRFISIPAAPSSLTDSLNVTMSAAIILAKLVGVSDTKK